MDTRATGMLAGAVLAVVLATAPAQASSGINAYRFKATAKNIETLASAGFDVTEGRRSGGRIEVYGTRRQMAQLGRKEKIRGKLVRDRRGRRPRAVHGDVRPHREPAPVDRREGRDR